MLANNRLGQPKHLLRSLYIFFVSCLFRVLSVGPLPNHIAFIMDGNRRYAEKNNIEVKDRYRPGLLALMSNIRHCYELGVRYITLYVFSIDNFKRHPEDVKRLMEIFLERIESYLEDDDFIKKYGVKLYFLGNLALLSEEVQAVIKRAMEQTAENTTTFLIACLAYTSTDEIVHAVEESFLIRGKIGKIVLPEIEKELYLSVAPKPDIVIRSSGETRLSNFLLWQTESCLLYCPAALWPEIGLRHLVWAVINFQRQYSYLQKIRNLS